VFWVDVRSDASSRSVAFDINLHAFSLCEYSFDNRKNRWQSNKHQFMNAMRLKTNEDPRLSDVKIAL
jgi:hypothetical protein